MKKSTFILILRILAAVFGAIVATLTVQSCSLTADFSKQKSGSTSSAVTYPSAANFHATRDSISFNYSDSTIKRNQHTCTPHVYCL